MKQMITLILACLLLLCGCSTKEEPETFQQLLGIPETDISSLPELACRVSSEDAEEVILDTQRSKELYAIISKYVAEGKRLQSSYSENEPYVLLEFYTGNKADTEFYGCFRITVGNKMLISASPALSHFVMYQLPDDAYSKIVDMCTNADSVSTPGEDASNIGAADQTTSTYLGPESFPDLIEETSNYKLYSNDRKQGYYYIIYDNTGDAFYDGYCTWRSDGIETVNGTLLMVREQSGGALYSAKYFDIENSRVSRIFSKPAGVSDSCLVAYFETDDMGIKLIVRDLFDPNGFYKELRDESFDIPVYTAECVAEFGDDDSSVSVTYMDKDRETVTKTFVLH